MSSGGAGASDDGAGPSVVGAGASDVTAGASDVTAGASDVTAGASDVTAGASDVTAGASDVTGVSVVGGTSSELPSFQLSLSNSLLSTVTLCIFSAVVDIRTFIRWSFLLPFT